MRVIWKIHHADTQLPKRNRFSHWSKFGKRKPIQRESCRWRRDKEDSTSVKETGTKTQSSRWSSTGQIDAGGGSVGLSDASITQASPEAREIDVGQARET